MSLRRSLTVSVAGLALWVTSASMAPAAPLDDSSLSARNSPAASDHSHSACRHGDRGRVLGVERVASHPTAADARAYFDSWIDFYQDYYNFPAELGVDIDYGFDTYKVTYCTVDARLSGQRRAAPTVATGNLSVPRRSGRLSTVAYLHGTSVSVYDAPSNPNVFGELEPRGESFDGPPASAVLAGAGFIFVAPDYPGLGDSTVPRHRYFDAQAEARSAADLLVASQRVLHRMRVKQSKDLFTFGFSQGGHAALALQRLLERRHLDVTATASVGGVYDTERWFLSMLDDSATATLPLYVSYLLLAYDDMYDVYGDPSEVFREPYADTVPGLFDMQHYFDDVLADLPPNSEELLLPSYFDAVRTNPADPMRVRLRQNAVDRWRPAAPIRIYHSPTDEEVFYEDALVSVDRLRRRGGDVTVETVSGDHVNSWIQALPRAAAYFASLD